MIVTKACKICPNAFDPSFSEGAVVPRQGLNWVIQLVIIGVVFIQLVSFVTVFGMAQPALAPTISLRADSLPSCEFRMLTCAF